MLLILGNLIAVFGLAIIGLWLGLLLGVPGILITAAAVIALGFASSRIFKIFRKKYELKLSRFILFSYVPSAIGAVIYWIVFALLDDIGFFTGLFAGLGEFLYGLSLSPTAAVYLISGIVCCLIANRANWKRCIK